MRYISFVILFFFCTIPVYGSFLPNNEVISYDTYRSIRNNLYATDFVIPEEIMNSLESFASGDTCGLQDMGNFLLITPLCLLETHIPHLPFQEAVSRIWPYVMGIDFVYDLDAVHFDYRGATPIIEADFSNFATFNDGSAINHFLILSMHFHKLKIMIPKSVIAYKQVASYGRYGVRKDMTNQGTCGRQNYMVGYNSLDGLLLEPNTPFSLNDHIAFLPGYCTGNGAKSYMFFAGACGVSTQLFRISLLHPDIEVLERHPHSVRRAYYYGPYIYGDDAAMYENNKKFIIQNTGQHPMLIKNLDRPEFQGKYNYLIAISPQKSLKNVTITKQEISNRAGLVQKIIYKQDRSIDKQTDRSSRYIRKHMSNR